MTTLYASNQPHDYSNSPPVTTDGAFFDNTRVPFAFQLEDYTTYVQRTPHAEAVGNFTSYHFRMSVEGTENPAGNDGYLLRIKDASGNSIAWIDTLNGLYAPVSNGDSNVIGARTGSVVDGTVQIDIEVTVDGVTDITVALYIDKALVGTAVSANTGGKGKPVRMDLEFSDVVAYNTTTPPGIVISEIIVADVPTLDLRVSMREPSVAGFHTDFTGDVSDISDNDDLTAMLSGVAGDRSSNTKGTLAAGLQIHSVVLSSRAAKDGTSPQTLNQGFRIGGVDYDGTGDALPATFGSILHEFAVSPATGLDWTVTEVDGAEMMMSAEA